MTLMSFAVRLRSRAHFSLQQKHMSEAGMSSPPLACAGVGRAIVLE
ncbi:hypothetical protein [Agrobacterium rosae]